MQVGDVIKAMRQAAGLTQVELSKRVGRARSWAGVVEDPKRDPSLSTVARVADACGYRVAVLDSAGREVLGVEPPREEGPVDQ